MLPSHKNSESFAEFTVYGYDSSNGNIIDGVTKKALPTVAMVHTHPEGGMPSNGDRNFASTHIPNKPTVNIGSTLLDAEGGLNGITFMFIYNSSNYPDLSHQMLHSDMLP